MKSCSSVRRRIQPAPTQVSSAVTRVSISCPKTHPAAAARNSVATECPSPRPAARDTYQRTPRDDNAITRIYDDTRYYIITFIRVVIYTHTHNIGQINNYLPVRRNNKFIVFSSSSGIPVAVIRRRLKKKKPIITHRRRQVGRYLMDFVS